MDVQDSEVHQKLYAWRREHAPRVFGPMVVRTYGARILLSDQIIELIATGVHAGRIGSVAQLAEETGWRRDWADAYGESLLAALGISTSTPCSVPTTANTEYGQTPTADLPELPTSE